MDATKNRGTSKIFSCFKPIVGDDYEPGCDSAALPSHGDKAAVRRRKRLRRSFSAALKAVLFKTSLLKKCRSENYKHDYDGSRGNLFSKSKKLVNTMKKTMPCKPVLGPEEISRTNSDRSSLFSSNSSSRRRPSLASSSSASSRSSHSRSGSDKLIVRPGSLDFGQMNQQKPMKRRASCGGKSTCDNNNNNNNNNNNDKFNLEMCVLLVCLVALVWGKAFAIVVCTSTWLLFAPASGHHRSFHGQKLRRFDSFDVIDLGEYKKRVIMQGLLERNRNLN